MQRIDQSSPLLPAGRAGCRPIRSPWGPTYEHRAYRQPTQATRQHSQYSQSTRRCACSSGVGCCTSDLIFWSPHRRLSALASFLGKAACHQRNLLIFRVGKRLWDSGDPNGTTALRGPGPVDTAGVGPRSKGPGHLPLGFVTRAGSGFGDSFAGFIGAARLGFTLRRA